MCGIFGIITREQRTLGPTLIEAGKMLSYRGYDSVGCATINQAGKIDLRKDVGKVDAVAEKYKFAEMEGSRGILQLRWATFGAPSQANSQPHLDSDGDLVGAHNGNVVNNIELRQQFIAEGMTVRSTNDGESCVHAVERYVNQGYGMVEAIRKAYGDLQGDYAFVIGKVDEDGLTKTKAFVVLAPEQQASAEDLQAFVKDRLAPFKYPRSVVFTAALPGSSSFHICAPPAPQQNESPPLRSISSRVAPASASALRGSS